MSDHFAGPMCICGHDMQVHKQRPVGYGECFWSPCECKQFITKEDKTRMEIESLQQKLDKYEEIAPCGHPERYWKVEVNQDAWCVMCALEDEVEKCISCSFNRENFELQKKLEIAVTALENIEDFRSTHYFGLQFEVWEIVKVALEKIKGRF